MDKSELLELGIDESAAEKVMEMAEKMKEEYETKLKSERREARLGEMLRDSGAKNVKAVRALLEIGGDDFEKEAEKQIAALKRDKSTGFLFSAGDKGFEPGFSSGKLPETTRDEYAERLKEARARKNTAEAIRIKQEAAAEGIVLL